MKMSDKKLRLLLIEKGMKKKDLQEATKINPSGIARRGRDESVSTETLAKICRALHCNIGDLALYMRANKFDWCAWFNHRKGLFSKMQEVISGGK
ncbi:MAG: helix-turn-helix transcriptional regulator [Christensenella sp.]|nr:helix-turn-helix transcriptional regulator [Christensenella sp.]